MSCHINKLTWKVLFPAPILQTRKPKPTADEACPGLCAAGRQGTQAQGKPPRKSCGPHVNSDPPTNTPRTGRQSLQSKPRARELFAAGGQGLRRTLGSQTQPSASLRGHSARMEETEPRMAQGGLQVTSTRAGPRTGMQYTHRTSTPCGPIPQVLTKQNTHEAWKTPGKTAQRPEAVSLASGPSSKTKWFRGTAQGNPTWCPPPSTWREGGRATAPSMDMQVRHPGHGGPNAHELQEGFKGPGRAKWCQLPPWPRGLI